MSTTRQGRPSRTMLSRSSQNLSASRCSSDRLLALRVVTFAVTVPLLMRFSLDRVAGWITPSGNASLELSRADIVAFVRRIDRWLARSRPFVRSGCLIRGLTLYHFLRQAGVPVSLCFGIGCVNGAVEGHCWIVSGGEPLGERRDPRDVFTETWAIPS